MGVIVDVPRRGSTQGIAMPRLNLARNVDTGDRSHGAQAIAADHALAKFQLRRACFGEGEIPTMLELGLNPHGMHCLFMV